MKTGRRRGRRPAGAAMVTFAWMMAGLAWATATTTPTAAQTIDIVCWGCDFPAGSSGDHGQCDIPTGIGTPENPVASIAAGFGHTVASLADGSVACWGDNFYGQCNVPSGTGTPENPVTGVAAGIHHTIAVLADGSLACWGRNDDGQCDVPSGVGTPTNPVTDIAAGYRHTVALLLDGSVACWGSNDFGECDVPVGVGTPANRVTDIATDSGHTVARLADGSIACWGNNSHGQCDVPSGIGTSENPVTDIAAGSLHTVAILVDGSVVCWGNNGVGQCDVPGGIGTPNTPAVSVAAGYEHTVAILADGSVACWGSNFRGQCDVPSGIGSRDNTVAAVTAGGSHTVARFDVPLPDCNENGIVDAIEIADGSAADCDDNGVPDSCDLATDDGNGDGIPDSCQPTVTLCTDGTCDHATLDAALEDLALGGTIELGRETFLLERDHQLQGSLILRGTFDEFGTTTIQVTAGRSISSEGPVQASRIVVDGLVDDQATGSLRFDTDLEPHQRIQFDECEFRGLTGTLLSESDGEIHLNLCTFERIELERFASPIPLIQGNIFAWDCLFHSCELQGANVSLLGCIGASSLRSTTFRDNAIGSFGLVYLTTGTPTIDSCTFVDNVAYPYESLARPTYCGVVGFEVEATITNCVFRTNGHSDGTVDHVPLLIAGGSTTIEGCDFLGNVGPSCVEATSRGYGSGTPIDGLDILDCRFAGNVSTGPTDCPDSGLVTITLAEGDGYTDGLVNLSGTRFYDVMGPPVVGPHQSGSSGCTNAIDLDGDGWSDQCESGSGTVILVPEDAPTIDDAIALAEDGDTIELAAGTHTITAPLRFDRHGLSINGTTDADGASSTTLMLLPDTTSEITITAETHFRDVIFVGRAFDAAETGCDGVVSGGITVFASPATFTTCSFSGFIGRPAIACDSGLLNLRGGTVVRDNDSGRPDLPGGVYVRHGTLSFNSSRLERNQNTAVDTAGGIKVEQGWFSTVGSDYEGNTGAVQLVGSSARVFRCRFVENESVSDGAAIDAAANAGTNATLEIVDTAFCDNGPSPILGDHIATGETQIDGPYCDDCDGDGVLDGDATGDGSVADCDGNGIPDSCDLRAIASASSETMPISTMPLALQTADLLPPLADEVVIAVEASGEFDSAAEFLTIRLDGEIRGYFEGGIDCELRTETFPIPAAIWNAAGEDGVRLIEVYASPAVDVATCPLVRISVDYDGIATDCNDNGIWDGCDLGEGDANDADGDGVPDECQPDCDGDGLPDAWATTTGLVPDCNLNLVPDACDIADGGSNDVDQNGVPDECKLDCNGNGTPDAYEIAIGDAADCNDNLIPDECEIAAGSQDDCNGNAIPDDCDLATGGSTDVDADGTLDECQIDCNENGLPDAWEIATGQASDCDDNTRPDLCDIESGDADDDNGNGIPDRCDLVRGDFDLDGCVGPSDLGFLLSVWGTSPPIGDLDGDGVVGATDLGELLSNWGCGP